jgi:glycosyl transferase family 25
MIEQLNRLQLDGELVEAVDGQSLTDQQLANCCAPMTIEMRRNYLTPGAIGCALSHLKALQMMLRRGDECACILEDDLLLPENFPTILEEIAGQITEQEVILLY